MPFRKHKKKKILVATLSASCLVVSSSCAAIIIEKTINKPIYKRIIPERMLKLSDDKTILYGFQDNVTISDIAAARYNTLEIPDSVEKINNYAFALMFDGYSSDVSEIDLNGRLETIGDNAFFNDWGIDTITFKDSVDPTSINLKYIGQEAFTQCDITGELDIPSTVEYIGDSAFLYCEKIDRLVLPKSLNTVGHYAFAENNLLTTIDLLNYDTIPEWLYMSSSAFRNAGAGVSPSIERSVMVNNQINTVEEWSDALSQKQQLPLMGKGAFSIISESRVVPQEYFNIEKKVDEEKTKYILKGFNGEVAKWIKDYDTIQVPQEVTEIQADAFKDVITVANGARCKIIFGGEIGSIGNSAFANCTGLVGTLSFASAITDIGENAFDNCRFSKVTMPFTLKNIGTRIFADNPSLRSCSISFATDANKFNNGQYFRNCPNLQFIDMTELGTDLPTNFENLTGDNVIFKQGEVAESGFLSIPLGASWKGTISDPNKWGFTLFSDTNPDAKWHPYHIEGEQCEERFIDSVDSDTIVKGLTEEGVEQIKTFDTIQLPQSTEVIGQDAFNHLFNRDLIHGQNFFWNVVLNNGLLSILDRAFYQCTGLEQDFFYLPKTLQTIGDFAFAECTGLRGNVEIPQALTLIGAGAFMGCTGLGGNIRLHGNMTIGESAFHTTNFSSLTITGDQPISFGAHIFAATHSIKQIDLTGCTYAYAKDHWQFEADSLFIDSPTTTELKVYVNNAEDIGGWTSLLQSMGLPSSWVITTR